MKEVVFHYVKKCTLVVANKTTLLHGKDSAKRVKNKSFRLCFSYSEPPILFKMRNSVFG